MAGKTSYRRDQGTDHKEKSSLTVLLVTFVVIAPLGLLAFALGWIDIASSRGDVDVELPQSSLDVDRPEADADRDVDGELEGDADAEVPTS